ncbi:MAG: Fe-S cluster assembly protein SufD [Acidobacteria bacterium]|nr:Fe-S cluster assembly protein SufD [Acidobacteriota bacterium]
MMPVAESNTYAPVWLAALRQQGKARFNTLGFPTTHDEEWRFTSVAPIVRAALEPSAPANVDGLPFTVPGACTLLVVNGRFVRADRAPKGVRLASLAEALRAEPELLERHLARYAGFENHAFAALNTGSVEDGAFVVVARNQVVETPIHLLHVAAGAGVSHPRTLVLAGANSQLSLVESYIGLSDDVYFTNAVTEICAGENAVVEHCKVQLERPQSFHVAVMQAEVGRSANLTSHSISFGAALARNDTGALLGEGSECTLNGLYMAGGRQHVDNHTAIDHAKPHAVSHQLYKGILDGHAAAVFNGKIYVRPDAQKTDAKQTNKNLLLSEDAAVNTKPELQIWADDVRCTHGATIGQLDAESIFYLQSRGIGREDARAMLTRAFAGDILERIRIPALRARLEEVLAEKL